MGMFDSYDEIYSKNNVYPSCPPKSCDKPKLDPCKPDKPYISYNEKGDMVGYWWYQGNTINLEFNIEGEVTYTESESNGEINNIQGINASNSGGYIEVLDFLKDKKITIKMYNFRHELVKYEDMDGSIKSAVQVFDGSQGTKYIFVIDELLASKLGKGNYYLSLTISSQGYNETILYQDDCSITIK